MAFLSLENDPDYIGLQTELIALQLKRWKLSTVDAKAQEKWQDFTHYKNKMFLQTSTVQNPWVIIKGNNKSQARLEAMRYVLNKIDYAGKGVTGQRLEPNSQIVKIISD